MPETSRSSEIRPRILLVDDMPANLLALHAILEDRGCEIVDATSASEALRLADELDFALVLLDLQMPGMNGLEIARLLRSRGRSRTTPIIFLTAFDSEEFSVTRAYELGAVDYLVKPLVPAVLRAKVAVFVDLFEKIEHIKLQSQQIQEAERSEFERRLAEERMQSRLALAAIVESSDDAIISETLTGLILTWNRGAERLFGYTVDEAVGRPMSLIIPAERLGEMTKYLADVRHGKRVEHFETVRRRKDGTFIAVSLTVSPVRNDQGEVIGASKTARDITERKNAEAAVRRSRQEIADILESISDSLTVVDEEWRIVYTNDATLQRIGRSRESVLGGNFWELFAMFRGTEVEAHLRRVMESRIPFRFEGIGPISRRWFDMTISPTAHGITVFSRDMHERRLAEMSLHESEQRFARFMQHLPGLAWLKDGEGRYVYVNDAAERAFGRSRTQLYGRTDADLFPPEIAGTFLENDRLARRSPTGLQIVESLQHPDGAIHHSLVSKFPIPSVTGSVDMIGGIAIDITERLTAESALKEADRLKDEFLAMLGHELRNPLSGIVGASRVLSMIGSMKPEGAEMIRVIDRQAAHMVHMINDLLDVSRISRGKIEIDPAPRDLVDIVRNACRDCRELLEKGQLALEVSLPPGPVVALADETRLTQVLVNLLQNAIKFTGLGGRISVVLRQDDKERTASLSVVDSGIGIPRDSLSRIFEPFAQVTEVRSLSIGGLGLGLAIVKGLVELHGGRVVAHSEGPGQGAEFVLTLPLVTADARPISYDHPEDSSLKARRILVVDDENDARVPLCRILELDGHVVRAAADGPSALVTAAEFRPEVVFCDIQLTGKMNGYDVARHLRSAPGTQSALLVAVTGFGQEKDRAQAAEAGFDHHLTKPASHSQLKELIERVPVRT